MLFGRNNVGEYHNFDLPKSQKFPSVFAWGPSRLILSGTIKAGDHQDFQFLHPQIAKVSVCIRLGTIKINFKRDQQARGPSRFSIFTPKLYL